MKKFLVFISRFLLFFWLVTFFIAFSLLGIRWLTSMKYQFVSTDLRLWEIYLPGILSICSVFFLVRPRFRERFNAIYIVEKDDLVKNGYVGHLLLLSFASFTLLSFSQQYFSGTYGNLITIKSLDEISEHSRERFFRIDSVAYNPYFGVFYEKKKRSVSGKNPKITMNHFTVNPLHDSRIQYYKPPLTYWMALRSRKRVSISRFRSLFTSSTPEDDIKNQWAKVYDQMDKYDISQVQFFYKPPSSGSLDEYKEAIASRYGEKIAKMAIVLEPKVYSFEERSNHLLSPFRVFIVSFPILILFLLVASFPNLKK